MACGVPKGVSVGEMRPFCSITSLRYKGFPRLSGDVIARPGPPGKS